jgi:hypothetical protein
MSECMEYPHRYGLFWERGTRLELATACLEGVSLFTLWRSGRFSPIHAVFSFFPLSENCPVMVS